MSKPLPSSGFRARRHLHEKEDFAMASGEYAGPTDLIDEGIWHSIVDSPDDVSIRTTDKYGPQLGQMWEYWGLEDLRYPSSRTEAGASRPRQITTGAAVTDPR